MAVPIRASSAHAYAYEDLKRVPTRSVSAQTFAYEKVQLSLFRAEQALTYAYEKVLTADPNQLHVWNAETNQYERVPWYVFNSDTGQWQQVI